MFKITDLRANDEEIAERERQQQADKLIEEHFLFSCLNKPGEYIKRFGRKFSRLNELKAEHFNTRQIIEGLFKSKKK